MQYRPSVTHSGRGRPKISISQEQLSFLVDQGFTVKEMSSVLGVGQRTIERRLSAFDLSIKGEQISATYCSDSFMQHCCVAR